MARPAKKRRICRPPKFNCFTPIGKDIPDGVVVLEVEIPREWVGRTVGDIDIRRKYNINVLAVKRDGKLDVTVNPDTCFTERDAMLVLGSNKDIHKCFRI